ncbi:hypothetical protein SPFL3102_03678 [Sporomusaceae bacterium FL31]|nr:hypothetical protein SPFL3101_02760 [Sporomusaceae bacterium FL31]GCE35825.1 hypothetical protein SPFL3102_03678 [Sporomusaceae bacterium]
MSIEHLIARIAYVLEQLDQVPAELKAESPFIHELEFLLDQYKDFKKEQKYRNSLLEKIQYLENDKKSATVE